MVPKNLRKNLRKKAFFVIYSKHLHIRNYDFGVQADQVLILRGA